MYKTLFGILCIMIFFIIFSSIYTLRVRLLESNIKKVSYHINEEYQVLQSLKAEWNYLNNPEYLKLMEQKYLTNMKPSSYVDNDKVLKVPIKPEINEN